MTTFYTALGYAGGWFGRRFYRRINMLFAPLISASICFAVFELGMAGYTVLASASPSLELLKIALLRIMLDVAAAEIMYIVFDKMIRPNWSRFAAR